MLELTDENFEKEIQNTKKLVLVDFYSNWCPPCQLLSPILEKLKKEFEEKISFTKIDLDSAPLTAQKFGITKIPTVILFKNGKPISQFIGLKSESEIKSWLKNLIE